MKSNIYDYDTMSDAKKIFAAMKKNSKDEREEYVFFKKKKDTYFYWLNWCFGIKFDVIGYEEESDNNAGVVDIEKQELRQGQTQNEG